MSGKIRLEVQARLTVRPLAKTLVRAQNAGEFASNLGASDSEVRIAQEGFAAGIFAKVIVYGVDGRDHEVERAAFSVDQAAGDGDDVISVEDDDSRSMIERTDKGFAEAVRRTKARYERKGLRPLVRFHYVDHIANDPAARARHNEKLGIVDASPVATADGIDMICVASIKPGKDPRQGLDLYWGKRRR
ncbi:MAG TPA: hypothetical protein VJ045_06105 [Hyphomicrobiaceae bacterium]|nr:hypothetical protein [Hyphomicrobiaceae bacterium]